MEMKNLLNLLERKIGRFYIHDLMKYLVIAMGAVYVLELLPMRSAAAFLAFDRARIIRGEVWRAVTYILLPPGYSLLSVLLGLYFLYLMGTSLERIWRGARFTLYYALGYVCTLAAGFIMGFTTNVYFHMTLLLCYAMMNPNQQFMLFYMLPVKVKWIGILDACLLLYYFIAGNTVSRVVLLFSLIPFFLFFWREVWLESKMAFRRLQYRINQYR